MDVVVKDDVSTTAAKVADDGRVTGIAAVSERWMDLSWHHLSWNILKQVAMWMDCSMTWGREWCQYMENAHVWAA